MFKTVVFIRHGQALHNVAPKDKTKLDPPLTSKGIEEATACREKILNGIVSVPNVIFTSTHERTLQTTTTIFADYIGSIPIYATEQCREVLNSFQCNKRTSLSEKRELYKHVDFTLVQDDDDTVAGTEASMPREEQYASGMDRARAFLLYLEGMPQTNIAVVTHGRFMQCLAGVVLGLDKYHCSVVRIVDNCETLTVAYRAPGRPQQPDIPPVWQLCDNIVLECARTEIKP
eukprot:gene9356-19408_t